jgi:hypothetical protein
VAIAFGVMRGENWARHATARHFEGESGSNQDCVKIWNLSDRVSDQTGPLPFGTPGNAI